MLAQGSYFGLVWVKAFHGFFKNKVVNRSLLLGAPTGVDVSPFITMQPNDERLAIINNIGQARAEAAVRAFLYGIILTQKGWVLAISTLVERRIVGPWGSLSPWLRLVARTLQVQACHGMGQWYPHGRIPVGALDAVRRRQ